MLGLAILLALISIWLSAVGLALQYGLSLLVALIALRRLLKPRPAPVRAVLQSDGLWLLAIDGREIMATLEASSLLAGLISMSWRDQGTGKAHTRLFWPDVLPAHAARQLRVWLRSGRAHRTDPAGGSGQPL